MGSPSLAQDLGTPIGTLCSVSVLMGLRRCVKWDFTVYNRHETTRGDTTASQAEMGTAVSPSPLPSELTIKRFIS